MKKFLGLAVLLGVGLSIAALHTPRQTAYDAMAKKGYNDFDCFEQSEGTVCYRGFRKYVCHDNSDGDSECREVD